MHDTNWNFEFGIHGKTNVNKIKKVNKHTTLEGIFFFGSAEALGYVNVTTRDDDGPGLGSL